MSATPLIPAYDVPETRPDPVLSESERQAYFERIKSLLKQHNAVLIAHYYVDPLIQQLAEESGGFVSDSLAMAQYGMTHSADTLVVAGVKFMGETAKILSPEKKVLMPTLEATCSLDLSCPADQFAQFCGENPDRTVVVYANTSAEVKALADWVVTSSCAINIINHLDAEDEKILWAPDRYLGSYLQKQTGADMLLWQGSCIVHEEFKSECMRQLKAEYPDAAVLVHPESPAEVIAMADVVGSTTRLVKAVDALPHATFIVATDRGVFYKMQQAAPDKLLLEAPTAGQGATCKSCAHCPWMAMNHLDNLERCLREQLNEVQLDPAIIKKAQLPLQRMVNFK